MGYIPSSPSKKNRGRAAVYPCPRAPPALSKSSVILRLMRIGCAVCLPIVPAPIPFVGTSCRVCSHNVGSRFPSHSPLCRMCSIFAFSQKKSRSASQKESTIPLSLTILTTTMSSDNGAVSLRCSIRCRVDSHHTRICVGSVALQRNKANNLLVPSAWKDG
jgi:hypothetical protein